MACLRRADPPAPFLTESRCYSLWPVVGHCVVWTRTQPEHLHLWWMVVPPCSPALGIGLAQSLRKMVTTKLLMRMLLVPSAPLGSLAQGLAQTPSSSTLESPTLQTSLALQIHRVPCDIRLGITQSPASAVFLENYRAVSLHLKLKMSATATHHTTPSLTATNLLKPALNPEPIPIRTPTLRLTRPAP